MIAAGTALCWLAARHFCGYGCAMATENRHGTCLTCKGPIYRHPYPGGGHPDRWSHRRTADWVDNPHEAQPAPEPEQSEEAGQ